jgi:restriction endonuclease Mrr
VQDEYDCLIAPILSLLKHGAERAEVSQFLHHELTDHFGLSHPYDVGGMAGRLTAWWASKHSQEA